MKQYAQPPEDVLERYDAMVAKAGNRTKGSIYHTRADCPRVGDTMIGRDFDQLERWEFEKCQDCKVMDGEQEPYQSDTKDRSYYDALQNAAKEA